jgi:Fur family transcriptional regulator, ferric uptake regulator
VRSADVEDVLRSRGHRVTAPRRAVWQALVESDGHLTAEELAERVTAVGHRVDLASVYRSLTLFEELDLARQSRLGGDAAGRWELAHPDEHFHMVCRSCGAVDHHAGRLVAAIREHLAGDHRFHVDQVELTVTGRCGGCTDAADPAAGGAAPSGAAAGGTATADAV